MYIYKYIYIYIIIHANLAGGPQLTSPSFANNDHLPSFAASEADTVAAAFGERPGV